MKEHNFGLRDSKAGPLSFLTRSEVKTSRRVKIMAIGHGSLGLAMQQQVQFRQRN